MFESHKSIKKTNQSNTTQTEGILPSKLKELDIERRHGKHHLLFCLIFLQYIRFIIRIVINYVKTVLTPNGY